MPRPTSSTSVGRPDLAALAYEHNLEASQRGFVGLQVLPIFEVQERSGQYPVIPNEALLKTADLKRAARGAYNRDDWEFEMGNYDCVEYGKEVPLDDSEAAMYGLYFDAERVSVLRGVDSLLRAQEIRIQAMLLNESNFSVNDVTNEWDDATNATPIKDVNTGKKTIRQACGMEPNALVLSRTIFDNLCLTDEIATAVRYTTPIEVMSMEAKKALVAQAFGLEKILVGDAVYDGAKKGQSFSATDVWGTEHALLCRVATSAMDLREPCLGRTFLWSADSPSNAVVEEYRDEAVRSNIYRVRHHVDEAFVFTACGYLLGNLTT